MTLSRIAAFAVGVVLAIIGLGLIWAAPTVILPNLVVGLVLTLIGVWVFLGLPMTI